MDAPQAQLPPSAADLAAPTAEAADLCREASHFDWAYMGVLVLADAGSVVLDSQVFQQNGSTGVRLLGPGLVGLTWGWSIGGAYLTLPQCAPGRAAGGRPPEGYTRSELPLAITFSVLAAAMAPTVVGIETGEGTQTLQWSETERSMRLVIASAAGVVGSVLPYLLPPRTWRAMQKLDRLRLSAGGRGAYAGYAFTF